ncbi:hypothetical protein IFM89_029356, partial [Coptis chinensis]
MVLSGEVIQSYLSKSDCIDGMDAWSLVMQRQHPLTWYKSYFSAPNGDGPLALGMGSMGKGQVWINGQSIGRYWIASANGEVINLISPSRIASMEWTRGSLVMQRQHPLTWYKSYFIAPNGDGPLALGMGSMGKGSSMDQWASIGRYWIASANVFLTFVLQQLGATNSVMNLGIGSVFSSMNLKHVQQCCFNLCCSLLFVHVGLKGEAVNLISPSRIASVEWTRGSLVMQRQHPLTWYKSYFSAPNGDGPLALGMGSMGKGQVWINGQSIGRYWIASANGKKRLNLVEMVLSGEAVNLISPSRIASVEWTRGSLVMQRQHPLTWYKSYFSAPNGDGPLALGMGSMGKGQVWINGQSIGRYWIASAN